MSNRQQRGLLALLLRQDVEQAALESGESEETLRSWLGLRAFRRELAEQAQALSAEQQVRIARLMRR
jgi:hypothetical protein